MQQLRDEYPGRINRVRLGLEKIRYDAVMHQLRDEYPGRIERVRLGLAKIRYDAVIHHEVDEYPGKIMGSSVPHKLGINYVIAML